MKLLDKMFPIKIFGAPSTLVAVDAGTVSGLGFRLKDSRKLGEHPSESSESFSKFNEIEEIYVRNNEDAKDLIVNINGVVTINVGTANEKYDAICVIYDAVSLDLNAFLKIYSFTSGEKSIFAKSNQKNKIADILKSINISIDIVDFVDFK